MASSNEIRDIVIREAVESDAQGMLDFVRALAAEPDILIPLAPGEFDITLEQEREVIAAHRDAPNSLFLLAFDRTGDDEELVGLLNCTSGKRKALAHAAELGISVKRGCRGQGIGRKLMERAVEWARTTPSLVRLELRVYAANAPAVALYDSLGFQREGVRRRCVHQRGRFYDDIIMALIFDRGPLP